MKCNACHGAGRIKQHKTLAVKIPAGVDEGDRIRLSGEGEHGINGGPSGDLYVLLHVRKHSVFERHGNDIVMIEPISFALACLGGEIEIPTISGKKIKMKVPPGTENDHVFRVKGQGIPYLGSYGRGDQLIKVTIDVPKKLTPRQRELLKEFAEIEGDETVNTSKSFY